MEHENRKSSFGDFLTGLLIGGTIGYVAALLSAPRPGEETREMLAERSREARDIALDTVQTAVDKTGKLVSESKDRLASAIETTTNRSREQAVEIKEKGGEVIHEAREQASDVMRQAADKVDPNRPEI